MVTTVFIVRLTAKSFSAGLLDFHDHDLSHEDASRRIGVIMRMPAVKITAVKWTKARIFLPARPRGASSRELALHIEQSRHTGAVYTAIRRWRHVWKIGGENTNNSGMGRRA